MPLGVPLCKECNHFNDWRRVFAVTTPVLGLLVALFSIVGVNLEAVLNYFNPERAMFLVGGDFRGPEEIVVVATNIGDTVGYISENLECRSDFGNLFFSAPSVSTVAAGSRSELRFEPASTFYIGFLGALQRGQLTIDSDCHPDSGACSVAEYVGSEWDCRINGHDRHGEVSVQMMSGTLYLWSEDNELKGDFGPSTEPSVH
jgi:hypothetical protein